MPCKPFVADYLRNKYGERIRIIGRGTELVHLKGLVQTGLFKVYHEGFTERYGARIAVEFPHLFIFRSGRVGIPSTACMDFNTFIRDQLAEGMNDWLDLICQSFDYVEEDCISTYLFSKGISPDNMNMDTWKKIRLRHKQKQNGGLLKKKESGQNVPQNVKMSFYGKT